MLVLNMRMLALWYPGVQVLNMVRAELRGFLGLAVMLEQTMCLAALVKGFCPSSPCPGIWESEACRACNALALSVYFCGPSMPAEASVPAQGRWELLPNP